MTCFKDFFKVILDILNTIYIMYPDTTFIMKIITSKIHINSSY